MRTKTEAWRWTEVRSRIWTTLLCCRPRIGISDSYRPYTEVYSRNPETRAEKDSYTTHYTLAHSYIKLYTPQNIAAAVITNRKRSVGLADPKFVPDIVHLSPGTSPASSPGSSLHGACSMLHVNDCLSAVTGYLQLGAQTLITRLSSGRFPAWRPHTRL